MSEERFERAAERYRLDEMLSAVPSDSSQLVVGFTPWEEDVEGWRNSVRRRTPEETADRPVNRTVWDDPGDGGARVLIDVYECDSTEDAIRALVELLAGNQLAVVPAGPEGVGLFSFMQPEGLPPAVMMVRANACVLVSSFGRTTVDVVPWASRIDDRIRHRPDRAEDGAVFEDDVQQEGRDRTLRLEPEWAIGENGYIKLFATGGTLGLRGDRVVVGGTGEVSIEAFIVEPGRPTYRSQRTIAGS